ncbi:MAG: 3-deoxy-manno-octulosonate cytidylyltransferase [Candidatus Omnitrophica bacterium]|nr:3-deoxy-manno-octulosonate cytidylyltransferase [Candidatus Omnitrophota bacterium]
MSVLGVIPARYGSTRLPAKPLAMIGGQSLIRRVYEQAKQAKRLTRLVVATDDQRIVEAVQQFGGTAVMTRQDHASGTDRVAEVARSQADAQLVINIQGDEPLMRPEMIDRLVDAMEKEATVPMGTLMTLVKDPAALNNPNVVKVIVDRQGFALYFSRSAIPYQRKVEGQPVYYKHLGIYAFRRDFLLKFTQLPPTKLEQAESLEQLRALEHGYRIKVVETSFDTVSVDTADDVKQVEKLLGEMRPTSDVQRPKSEVGT